MLSLVFSIVARWRRRRGLRSDACLEQERWSRDPLSHPSIARMSARQLADLPAGELRPRPHC